MPTAIVGYVTSKIITIACIRAVGPSSKTGKWCGAMENACIERILVVFARCVLFVQIVESLHSTGGRPSLRETPTWSNLHVNGSRYHGIPVASHIASS